jgi:hypothetical protein
MGQVLLEQLNIPRVPNRFTRGLKTAREVRDAASVERGKLRYVLTRGMQWVRECLAL